MNNDLERWLGAAWLCPACGKVLRRPPYRNGDNRGHSGSCAAWMVPVRIERAS